ncbi:MAG: XTP/dITP diphosphohydrolase [Chlamydiales bacterium]|jgi:XTP/dITP diphosphohydrolase
MELVLATSNLHKVREFREMLDPIKNLDILSLIDFPDYEPPEETGKTFEDNALIKAMHACQEFNKCVIADDSGLVVPSLGNEPGVYSARYAGENCSDSDNRNKLLKALDGKEGAERMAYFECCIVMVQPDKQAKSVSAICEGSIISKEQGGNGFGYDPLFLKDGYTKTFAELTEATKNRISHRRKAFDKFLLLLEPLLKN